MSIAGYAVTTDDRSIEAKLPIFGTAVRAWSDVLRAAKAMRSLLVASVGILALAGGLTPLVQLLVPDPVLSQVHGQGIVTLTMKVILDVLVLAPLAIAVHRYVLLGEVALDYELSNPRYLRYIAFWLLVSFLPCAPFLIGSFPPKGPLTCVAEIGALIVFVIVAVRRTALFPAIAVDASWATSGNAAKDAKAYSWRTIGMSCCAVFPIVIIGVPLTLLVGEKSPIGVVLLTPISQTLSVCVSAAVASHLHRALAVRLNGPSRTQLDPSILKFLLVFGIFTFGFMAISGVGVLMVMLSTPGWSNDTRWWIAGGVLITIVVAYISGGGLAKDERGRLIELAAEQGEQGLRGGAAIVAATTLLTMRSNYRLPGRGARPSRPSDAACAAGFDIVACRCRRPPSHIPNEGCVR
jgi:hypothetical protein